MWAVLKKLSNNRVENVCLTLIKIQLNLNAVYPSVRGFVQGYSVGIKRNYWRCGGFEVAMFRRKHLNKKNQEML